MVLKQEPPIFSGVRSCRLSASESKRWGVCQDEVRRTASAIERAHYGCRPPSSSLQIRHSFASQKGRQRTRGLPLGTASGLDAIYSMSEP